MEFCFILTNGIFFKYTMIIQKRHNPRNSVVERYDTPIYYSSFFFKFSAVAWITRSLKVRQYSSCVSDQWLQYVKHIIKFQKVVLKLVVPYYSIHLFYVFLNSYL